MKTTRVNNNDHITYREVGASTRTALLLLLLLPFGHFIASGCEPKRFEPMVTDENGVLCYGVGAAICRVCVSCVAVCCLCCVARTGCALL